MADVRVTLKNGEKKTFDDHGAAGGSYSQTVTYEPGWLVITHASGAQTAYPSDQVAEVHVAGVPRW